MERDNIVRNKIKDNLDVFENDPNPGSVYFVYFKNILNGSVPIPKDQNFVAAMLLNMMKSG